MKIVYLTPRDVYDHKMSRVRFQQITAIGRQVPVVWTGPGWAHPLCSSAATAGSVTASAWDEGLSPAENVARIRIGDDQAEVVVAYQVGGLAGMHCPVVTQFNEGYDVPVVDAAVRDMQAALVIFHHANDVPLYSFWKNKGIYAVHLPHCVDVSVFQDFGEEKTIDILCAGNMNSYYYPFRYRLRCLALDWFRKRGYTVMALQHPGYSLPPREGTYVGAEFARLLNRAKLVFTCSMRYNYALAKYSEIAACRSLAVADVPAERRDFFLNTILNVEPWMTDAQIVHIVEGILDDESGELKRRTAQAFDRTTEHYAMEDYAERFIEACRKLLEDPLFLEGLK